MSLTKRFRHVLPMVLEGVWFQDFWWWQAGPAEALISESLDPFGFNAPGTFRPNGSRIWATGPQPIAAQPSLQLEPRERARRALARRASELGGRVLGICPKRRALFLYKIIISVWLKHSTGQPSDPFGLNSNPDPFGFKMQRMSCQSSI